MDPVSLALSIVGALDICLMYGKRLVELCRDIRNVRNDIAQIALAIEGAWLKTEVQLGLLKRLSRSGSLDPALSAHYGKALQRLRVKISGAVTGFEAVHKRSVSATKFPHNAWTVYLKRHLEEVVSDLEEWQRRFDPSWYLITFIASPLVDKQLESKHEEPSAARLLEIREAVRQISSTENATNEPVFKSPTLVEEQRQHISGTNTYISRYVDSRWEILLDSTSYTLRSASTSRAHVRDLARLLHHVVPPTFSLLKCEGVIEVLTDQDTQYQFIFGIPLGLTSPRTLRSLLMECPLISLSKCVQLAKQLARSIMFVHTTGFVHKGIRPETILIFHEGNQDIGPSFLVGFERIGRAEAQTDLLGDLEWERNIYRHPVRQGLWSEEAFIMQHDIYSLGVCLLEVALWVSFVRHDGNGMTTPWSDLDI
ncbi:uncharacterized protein BDW43DRAFT_238944 [Aspergillus alliaceus]|uniref:uncharacterized protein n=1 Tax=Petromyces alliaceus TaxID=209559 RepID=UPI0012A6D4EC|nr:uncharacterized protein BDW43DRAFT_238944 [Aspergillus alliaceus]KAB8227658.1 hypothetical protein BDW43DRAFT_238944 [Aspergillus alliaceus]